MLFDNLHQFISRLNLSDNLTNALTSLTVLTIFILVSWIASRILRSILNKIVSQISKKTKSQWDDILVEKKVFHRLAHLVPAIILQATAPLIFPYSELLISYLKRIIMAYMAFLIAFIIDAFLNSLVEITKSFQTTRDKPIQSYAQVLKILLYLITIIFSVALLIDRSPVVLLSGLGAMTAVLLLVFKDSILGLVASIQIAAYNLVKVGDWIEVPKYGADGDVIEMSLSTVKVQNWDKTISTLPTYALISDSFKNWRGMSESGGRRIKRALHIDMSSVKFLEEELLNRLKKIQVLSSYLADKENEIQKDNESRKISSESKVNGRKLTNLGTFRAYVERYLRSHPLINQEMTFLVRHLQPTEKGLPLEIYVFSKDKVWANYEALTADIFDHLLAVVSEFDLRVFQNPTGYDWRRES